MKWLIALFIICTVLILYACIVIASDEKKTIKDMEDWKHEHE